MALAACPREARVFEGPPSNARPAETGVQRSELVPAQPLDAGPAPVAAVSTRTSGDVQLQENAYAIQQGLRLFVWMNCVGCHSQGGGGMGVALIDATWRYGHEPANVYASIVEGRPNGMPAFRGKITEEQAWQLTAYVRSLSGLTRLDVTPGRADMLTPYSPLNADHAGDPRPSGERFQPDAGPLVDATDAGPLLDAADAGRHVDAADAGASAGVRDGGTP